uniref:Uncharacterized protein n=1 Tax=Chelydra serpentina TaxID=8475 RepID=A0A8C3SGL4_CHESE
MISRWLLQRCLMLLFSSEISCLDCNRIYVLQTRMNSENILKIRLSQQENAEVAIQQILKELFHIFNNNLTQAAWNGTSIKEFQNGLHQQIEKLGTCLSNLLLTSLKLERYFQTIDNFLKEKQYSQCAKASDSTTLHLTGHTLPHGIDDQHFLNERIFNKKVGFYLI